jgi:DNA-binding transcriptional LysR family regulator
MDFHLSHDLLTPLLREDIDLAIDCVEHNLSELERTPLFREAYMVACAPSYLAAQEIAQPADLARCTVLSIDKECSWWERFLQALPKRRQGSAEPEARERGGQSASGDPRREPDRQPAFGRVIQINHIRGMITGAVDGMGVLIAPSYSLQGELERGALVPLFPTIRPLEDRFALYQKSSKAKLAKHKLLKTYLQALEPSEFGV